MALPRKASPKIAHFPRNAFPPYTSLALLFFVGSSTSSFSAGLLRFVEETSALPPSASVSGRNLYANAVPSFEFLTMLLFCAIIKILWPAHHSHAHARPRSRSRSRAHKVPATKLHCKTRRQSVFACWLHFSNSNG